MSISWGNRAGTFTDYPVTNVPSALQDSSCPSCYTDGGTCHSFRVCESGHCLSVSYLNELRVACLLWHLKKYLLNKIGSSYRVPCSEWPVSLVCRSVQPYSPTITHRLTAFAFPQGTLTSMLLVPGGISLMLYSFPLLHSPREELISSVHILSDAGGEGD